MVVRRRGSVERSERPCECCERVCEWCERTYESPLLPCSPSRPRLQRRWQPVREFHRGTIGMSRGAPVLLTGMSHRPCCSLELAEAPSRSPCRHFGTLHGCLADSQRRLHSRMAFSLHPIVGSNAPVWKISPILLPSIGTGVNTSTAHANGCERYVRVNCERRV